MTPTDPKESVAVASMGIGQPIVIVPRVYPRSLLRANGATAKVNTGYR